MPKIVLNPVGNFNSSGVTILNDNFDRIEAAVENTLSRDGSTPNQMTADIDLNGNDLLNVGTIQADSFAVEGSEDFYTLIEQAQEASADAIAAAAAAEISADEAAASAGTARNNATVDYFTGDGTTNPITLSGNPGTMNNVTIIIESLGPQPKNKFSLNGLQVTPTDPWPSGKAIEATYGAILAVATPADGSVTTLKMGNDAVTYAKMQDISAQYRILGRKSSGAGDPEEVTASEFFDFVSTTRGVILYRGASSWSALAPGTAGYLLSTNGAGADPSYVAPPSSSPRAFKANKNATAQTSVATNTKVTFTTEVFDQASEYDATNSRWTPAAGKHPVTAQLYYSTGLTDTAEYGVSIKKNGTTVVATGYARASGTTSCCVQVNDIVDANGTDYFEVFTYVGIGTPNIGGTITDSYFAGGKG